MEKKINKKTILTVLFYAISLLLMLTPSLAAKMTDKQYEAFEKLEELKKKDLLEENCIPVNEQDYQEIKKIHKIIKNEELVMTYDEYVKAIRRQLRELKELRKEGLVDEYDIPVNAIAVKRMQKVGLLRNDKSTADKFEEINEVNEATGLILNSDNIKDQKKAVKKLELIIQRNPSNERALLLIGEAYLKMYLLSEKKDKTLQSKSENYWAKAIELNPAKKNDIKRRREDIYLLTPAPGEKQKRLKKEEARKYLDEGDKHMLYGINLSSSAKYYNAAVESFNKAIELDPDDPDGYISLGIAYDKLEKYSEAVSEFKKALKRSVAAEDINRIRIFLAGEYKKQNKHKKAEKEYKQILKQDPNNEAAKEGFKKLKAQ